MLVKVKAKANGHCKRGSRHHKGRKGCFKAKHHK
jgi:hypothetical protein